MEEQKLETGIAENENSVYFRIVGAGKIKISINPTWHCSGEVGYSFDLVSDYGLESFSGILPKDQAKKFAEHILSKI